MKARYTQLMRVRAWEHVDDKTVRVVMDQDDRGDSRVELVVARDFPAPIPVVGQLVEVGYGFDSAGKLEVRPWKAGE